LLFINIYSRSSSPCALLSIIFKAKPSEISQHKRSTLIRAMKLCIKTASYSEQRTDYFFSFLMLTAAYFNFSLRCMSDGLYGDRSIFLYFGP